MSYEDLKVGRGGSPELPYSPAHQRGLAASGGGQIFVETSEAEPTLAFHNVSYIIPPGLFSRKEGKVILEGISGLMPPGLNAIMGPTGSGKTTLLDILANRKASSRVSGSVLFNSVPIKPEFRFSTGYVIQEDILTGTLTVRENLHFSAALRLPASTTSRERRLRVNKIINQLKLSSCADQRIGTEFIRGVSGGERKRTNIGMELIIEPEVLFLDEPTTGLDAHTAIAVVQLIKNLTMDGNRVVVMSIHQPRYSIFKLFDTLTLLSQGKLIYHGLSADSLSYFNRLGFHCEEHDNPADFFLDIIDSCELRKQEEGDDEPLLGTESPSLQEDETRLDLAQSYRESEEHQEVQRSIQPMQIGYEGEVRVYREAGGACFSPYATNSVWQFLMVSKRAALKMWRNPMTNVMQLIVMVIFALIVGGIYFQRSETPRGMQDRIGAFLFIIMSQVFGSLGAVELFINERASFLHETSSGYYRVSVFFVAKCITDLLIIRAIPLSVFSAITYFMIGLEANAAKFFLYYLTLVLSAIGGAAIAFTFSAMVSVFSVANLLTSLIFVFFMIFGGALIGLNSLPSWIRWVKYISLFRYSMEAIAVNELKNKTFRAPLNGSLTCLFPVEMINNTLYCVADGNKFLEFQGYEIGWGWWVDQAALAINAVVWLVLTYLVLRIVKWVYQQYK